VCGTEPGIRKILPRVRCEAVEEISRYFGAAVDCAGVGKSIAIAVLLSGFLRASLGRIELVVERFDADSELVGRRCLVSIVPMHGLNHREDFEFFKALRDFSDR